MAQIELHECDFIDLIRQGNSKGWIGQDNDEQDEGEERINSKVKASLFAKKGLILERI